MAAKEGCVLRQVGDGCEGKRALVRFKVVARVRLKTEEVAP